MSRFINLGPPFKGITTAYQQDGLRPVGLDGLLVRKGYLDSAPCPIVQEENRPCGQGIYIFGVDTTSTVVTLGIPTTDLTYTTPMGSSIVLPAGHVIYMATRQRATVIQDLTLQYNELPKRNEPYSFATLHKKSYFACGQQVFEIDQTTLVASPVTFEEGRESGTVPYIVSQLPARCLLVHAGLMWYGLGEAADLATSMTLPADDPYIKEPDRLNSNGTIRYFSSDILFSDPAEPNHVQHFANFNVDDDGAEVMGLVPWNNGLLIVTSKGPWFLGGDRPENFYLTQISRYSGCVAPRSVVAIGDAVWWVGRNAVWVLDSANGLRKVPGLDWMFNASPEWKALSALDGGSEIYYIVKSYTSAAPVDGGNYYSFVVSRLNPGGVITWHQVWVETATLAVSLSQIPTAISGKYCSIAEAETSGLLTKWGGLVVGLANAMAFEFVGGPIALAEQEATLHLMLQWNSPDGQKVVVTGIQVDASDVPNSGTYKVISLDDIERYGGNSSPLKSDEMSGGSFQVPLADYEEAAVWDDSGDTWQASPPPAGTVKPRWHAGVPCVLTGKCRAVGTRFLVIVRFDITTPMTIQALRLEVEAAK